MEQNYTLDFNDESLSLSTKENKWTFKNILLILAVLVVGTAIILPSIMPSSKNIEEKNNEQTLERLDVISKRLSEIWLRLEEIYWIESELDYEKDNLISEQTMLNDEASSLFLSLVTPEIASINSWFIEWIEEKPIDEWQPWDLTEDWDHQVMPEIDEAVSDSHERFKAMAEAYWLDASMIWNVENHYWLTEWVVLCITVAETSGWNRWAWWKNIWSVGSNDRWDRPTFALMESGLEAIWKTLTNQYLWSKKTLGCLSNAGSCVEPWDNWKRYATSEHSWQANMVACLSEIYWPVNASNFNIRR